MNKTHNWFSAASLFSAARLSLGLVRLKSLAQILFHRAAECLSLRATSTLGGQKPCSTNAATSSRICWCRLRVASISRRIRWSLSRWLTFAILRLATSVSFPCPLSVSSIHPSILSLRRSVSSCSAPPSSPGHFSKSAER